MRSTVTQISSRVAISEVRDVQITEVVADGTGGFVRAVKVFGAPEASAGPALILEILIQSEAKSDLDITTPELSF